MNKEHFLVFPSLQVWQERKGWGGVGWRERERNMWGEGKRGRERGKGLRRKGGKREEEEKER